LDIIAKLIENTCVHSIKQVANMLIGQKKEKMRRKITFNLNTIKLEADISDSDGADHAV